MSREGFNLYAEELGTAFYFSTYSYYEEPVTSYNSAPIKLGVTEHMFFRAFQLPQGIIFFLHCECK